MQAVERVRDYLGMIRFAAEGPDQPQPLRDTALSRLKDAPDSFVTVRWLLGILAIALVGGFGWWASYVMTRIDSMVPRIEMQYMEKRLERIESKIDALRK